MPTVFYSWQDDLDPKTNRTFIGNALREALTELNRTLDPDQQLSLDTDTRAVPGHPDIADEIFAKIERCIAFVGDVSFVSRDRKKRGVPNPNVSIEYGFARRAIGSAHLVCVSNNAHGLWTREAAPFHFVDRRFPISYRLASDASRAEWTKVKADLKKSLVEAISLIEKTQRPPLSEFETAIPKWDKGSFLGPREPLDLVLHPSRNVMQIALHKGARSYLRLFPRYAPKSHEPLGSPKQLLELLGKENIRPLGHSDLPFYAGTVSDGAVTIAVMYRAHSQLIDQLTKLFESGEIWGVDCYWPNQDYGEPDDKDYGRQIPIESAAFRYFNSLDQYRTLLTKLFVAPYPMKLIAGIEGIRNHRVTGLNDVGHPILKTEVVHEAVIEGAEVKSSDALRPLLDKLAAAAGFK